ncbi:hypothetical protein ACFL5Z_17955 [Planctomycetota bacterium]
MASRTVATYSEMANNNAIQDKGPSTAWELQESVIVLEKWLHDREYEGYEPYDGLSSYLRPLTLGNRFAERVLGQIVLRCPFNIRPLIGVRAAKSASGMGLLARGYLRMWILTKDVAYKNKATSCLDWLNENQSCGYSGHCWGLNYDHTSRGGRMPKHMPNVVSTSLIGHAFLDAYEMLGDRKYLDVAISTCTFILKDLPREETRNGSCISYVPFGQNSVHNSNMLAAAMLARTAEFTADTEILQVAKEAIVYSCSRQLSDGAWYYGEDTKYHWIDNFHTGYNLDSLKCYIESTNDKTFEANLSRGFKYYKDIFIEYNGRPNYYHDRAYPVDIQCAAQAIDTLSNFAECDDSALNLALKVADWTIKNMQDRSGYFYYRNLRWKKVKISMVRWGQATMFCALTHLLSKSISAGTKSQ